MPATYIQAWKPKGTVGIVTDGDLSAGPIVLVGCGTAQCHRVWKLADAMASAGGLNRIQAVVAYDINQSTRKWLNQRTRRSRGPVKAKVFQAEYIPAGDGFNRNPYSYEDYKGLIDLDQSRIINEVKEQAELMASPPQLFVVYLGFGGHALVGLEFYQKLRKAFPRAKFLPILLIPDEAPLKDGMAFGVDGREPIWQKFEQVFAAEQSNGSKASNQLNTLVTDNSLGEQAELDFRLAVCLAAMECGAQSNGVNSDSLADTIESLSRYSSGWYGVSHFSKRLPNRMAFSWLPPFRRQKLVTGKSHELTWLTRCAIKEEILERETQLADHDPPQEGTPQRVVVAIPVAQQQLEAVWRDIRGQLDQEGFLKDHSHWSICPAALRFVDRTAVDERKDWWERWGFKTMWGALGGLAGVTVSIAASLTFNPSGWTNWLLASLGSPVGLANGVAPAIIGLGAAGLVGLTPWLFAISAPSKKREPLLMHICRFYPLKDERILSVWTITRERENTYVDPTDGNQQGLGTSAYFMPMTNGAHEANGAEEQQPRVPVNEEEFSDNGREGEGLATVVGGVSNGVEGERHSSQ